MMDSVPTSCKGVAIKKINSRLAAPINFKTVADCPEGIFFDIFIKKTPYPTEWNAIPIIAQILPEFFEPLIAFGANKLLRKFFDQPNPIEFLSGNEPPGYSNAAITSNITEVTRHIKTAYFLIICFLIAKPMLGVRWPVFINQSAFYFA
jgi:hypothetical protein